MSDFISALAALIFGIKATVTPAPSNSPASSTVCFNQEMVKKGERITNDDEGVTEYERERVQQMSMDYCLENDVTPPDPKNHKRFEKHSWTDIFFGTRGHEEDKEE